jgi:hypothetical protein
MESLSAQGKTSQGILSTNGVHKGVILKSWTADRLKLDGGAV